MCDSSSRRRDSRGYVVEAENYRIEVGPTGLAECRVWKRPDLAVDEGARLAKAMCDHLESLMRSHRAKALLLDLAEAPPAFGPKTEASMTGALTAAERLKKPVALVLGDKSIQRLQLERVVRLGAPTCGRLFSQRAAAEAWIAAAMKG